MARPILVVVALAAALGTTAGLLAWLSPAPLAPDVVGRLFQTQPVAAGSSRPEADQLFAPIFKTQRPIEPGRWQYLYIHHSNTPGGDAASLADAASARGIAGPPDHFVIGNGIGCGDGEVQFTARWDEQRPARGPTSDVDIDPACISICVIGDFDRMAPTPAQRERVAQLVEALRRQLGIPREHLILLDRPDAAGTGRFFAGAGAQ